MDDIEIVEFGGLWSVKRGDQYAEFQTHAEADEAAVLLRSGRADPDDYDWMTGPL